jgi:hypothetical protein
MPDLALYTVRMRHKIADITGRIAVHAENVEQARKIAIEQAIDISYPESSAADWVVLEVLA